MCFLAAPSEGTSAGDGVKLIITELGITVVVVVVVIVIGVKHATLPKFCPNPVGNRKSIDFGQFVTAFQPSFDYDYDYDNDNDNDNEKR